MKILSTAFPHDGPMPPQYTCDGKDVSPPLEWSGVPKQADGVMRREELCEVLYVALRRREGEAPSPRAASRAPPRPPGSR